VWVAGIPQFHQSKVHEYHLSGGAYNHVLWLRVSVDYPLRVTICQCIQQLACPFQHLCLWQCALSLNALGQALAFDKVHHQVGIPVFFKKVGHPYQVRMVEAGQNHGLLPELLAQLGQALGIQAGLGSHLLEGHQDIETHVPGAVDGPHAALP